MQEIIPFIEDTWIKYAEKVDIKYNIVDVDNISLKEIFTKAFNCKKVVVTAFNADIAKVMLAIRTKFQLDVDFIFYLHGFSSLGCWPLAEWKLTDIIKPNDCFISSASRDVAQFKVSSKSKVFKIPFSIEATETKIDVDKNLPLSLYYVGRISEQKNIHVLLYALYLFKQLNEGVQFTLDIFGEYDKLGSPNMGLQANAYDKYIQNLIKNLKLENEVITHGFVKRELIQDLIQPGKKIFVSASLHSDENFGMAVLKALISGHKAILSDWGGFSDFGEYYPDSTQYVQTIMTDHGPVISPHSLVKSLTEVSNSIDSSISKEMPRYYTMENILELINEVYNYSNESEQFGFNQYPKELALKRKEFISEIACVEEQKKSCKIYNSYSDNNAIELMSNYATQKIKIGSFEIENKYQTPPWVEISDDMIEILDPHRGPRRIRRENIKDNEIYLYNGVKVKISSTNLKSLWLQGYAFEREAL
jgi:glycosyltransferase involved in cell wall biosynthesis